MIPLRKFSIAAPDGAELRISLDPTSQATTSTLDLPIEGAVGEEEVSFDWNGQIAPNLAFEEDSTCWDLLEPLRLVENVEYEVSLVVPMPRMEFETRRRQAADGVYPFANLKLKDSMSFNGIDCCQQMPGARYLVTGRLKFDNQLGGVDLSLSEDVGQLEIRAEVTSNKLDYENDFRELLDQLSQIHAEVILNLDAPTDVVLRMSDSEPSLQMLLLHLRRLFEKDNLPLAIATILGNPLSRYAARRRLETTAFVTDPDWVELQTDPSAITWVQGGPLAPMFGGVTPATLPVRTVEKTFDTAENRFVKYAIGEVLQLIKHVRNRLKRRFKASHRNLENWQTNIEELLLHPFWECSGECRAFPNSMVMYERHGYRDFMQGVMLLDLALLVESDYGAVDHASGDLKPIWELYETWCYFQLRFAIKAITGCEGSPSVESLIRSTGFSTDLKSGESACTCFAYEVGGKDVQVKLHYNRWFLPNTDETWAGSYSTRFKPDFSIEVVRESAIVHWVHFDAKYRVAFSRDLADGSDQRFERSFKVEDIDRMHTYRDAILGTRGCYVLYPGNKSESTIYVRHPKQDYRDQWPGPSVGAVPLCPGKGTLQEEQRANLQSLMRTLLEASGSASHYTEEEGFLV